MRSMRSYSKATSIKKLKLFKGYAYSVGGRKRINPEPRLTEISFYTHKFNNRKRPKDNKKILIVPAFYEFGVETIGVSYCIPQIIHSNPDCYVIVVGWYGRSFLYSKIADEYWEIKEEYQWLREYADAFRNNSRAIGILENKLSQIGKIAGSGVMAKLCVQYYCVTCNHYFFTSDHLKPKCTKCFGNHLVKPLFGDLNLAKKKMWKIPDPSEEKIQKVRKILSPNSVAIFARNRMRYGRNLSINFYVKLINLLKQKGYDPIWVGEKQSVYACPDPTILDLTNCEEARDLELTLAVIKQCKFTIQFYTASTRLASMVKTPWILFESADQLIGVGQEGMRIVLTTDFDKKKIVISNFQQLYENEDLGIDYCNQAIDELSNKNFETIVGMVDDKSVVIANMEKFKYWWRLV